MSRYARCFEKLASRNEGAFVPFVVLGDPTPAASREVVEALVSGGADMLELGIPFSDPVADGPTIQAADRRALSAGTRPRDALGLVAEVRAAHPELPIGLLVYANLVEAPGRRRFYGEAAAAGVDSVLVADVPTLECGPYAEDALAAGIEPVLIAAPNASDSALDRLAHTCRGYTYVVSRVGVTGTEDEAGLDHQSFIADLQRRGAPPALLGFGISSPEQVRAALAAGAAGAISGSAVVKRIEQHLDDPLARSESLTAFVATMKAATTGV